MVIKTKNRLLFLAITGFFCFGLAFGLPKLLAQENGLVAYWALDENSGNTATDSAGSNTGTLLNGPTWTTGQYNSALSFDGTDDYVDLGTGNFNLTDSLTVSAWVNVSSANSGYATIIGRGQYLYPFWLQLDIENKIRFGIRTTSANYLTTDTRLNTGQWYHLAATYQNGERIIYINGQPSKSDTLTGALYQKSGEKTLLGNTPNSTAYFNGTIDDVRIYNRALSAQEISDLYNNAPVTLPDEPPACTPNWSCSGWSSCSSSGTQTQTCTDTNTCELDTNKPAESQSCTYTPPAASDKFFISKSGNNADGKSWATAWNELNQVKWSDIKPDNTIYIAGGTYNTQMDIKASGTASNYIVIKRATAEENNNDAGWNSGFDSQVFLNDVSFTIYTNDYILIDGVKNNGIKIKVNTNHRGIDLSPGNGNPSNYITLRNLEIEGPGINNGVAFSQARGINSTPVTGTPTPTVNGLLIENCEVYNFGQVLIRLENNYDFIIQNCKLHDIGEDDPSLHEAIFKAFWSSGTIKNNLIYNFPASGISLANGSKDFEIYGNVIYNNAQYAASTAGGIHGDGDEYQTNIKIYNNTFYNVRQPIAFTDSFDTAEIKNNLMYGGAAPVYSSGTTHSYNWYGGGITAQTESNGVNSTDDPFSSRSTFNFTLKSTASPINKGASLDSEYNQDLLGNTRGADGTWDIGAYEYSNATPPPACTPNWSCTNWIACLSSGTQTRTCTDVNACGVSTNKPVESQACTYVCNVDWSCTSWSACSSSSLQTRTCTDVNACGVNTGKPDQTQSCVYTTPVATCNPSWSCTTWSSCTPTKINTRTCRDLNSCNKDTGKPSETQSCTYTAPGGGSANNTANNATTTPATGTNATSTPQTSGDNNYSSALPGDSDGDGLSDEQETTLGTDVYNVDSDFDSYNDKEEVDNGYDPLTPTVIKNINTTLRNELKGYILLQVQRNGEAWYVHPIDGLRYYLRNGEIAYQIMRFLSLGISDADLAKIPVAGTTGKGDVNLVNRLKGYILLQVQQHGEAWYVNPFDGKRYYMKDGPAAYELMRFHSLGITNENLGGLPLGTLMGKIK